MMLIGKINTAWKTNAQTLGLGKHNYCRYVAPGPRAQVCATDKIGAVGWEKG